MEFEHCSVLLKETIDNLKIKNDGIYVDGTLGGGGHSYLAYIAVIEELAKHCSTTSGMLSDHHSLGSFPISEFGTEEQK